MKDHRQDGRGSAGGDDQAKALELHQRILDGEPAAQARLYELFAVQICKILAAKFPAVQANHPDWIEDAVTDGMTDYLLHPARYDPGKRALLGYLVMVAEGDLRNRRGREARRVEAKVRIVSLDTGEGERVGMEIPDRNVDIEAEFLSALEEDGDFVSMLRRNIPDDDDWTVLQLMADRSTGTADYAAALGLDLPSDNMARRAYAHKERVRKRARRCWDAYKAGRQVRPYKRRSGDDQEPPRG